MERRMKIALIGPYPPPYGGISIHIQRMEALLLDHGHIPVIFSQGGAKKWVLLNFGKWSQFDIIHFHDISLPSRILIGLLGFLGFKVILTIHGDSLKNQLGKTNWVLKNLLIFALRHISHIVGVKTEIQDELLLLGIEPSRMSVINAYLPPILDQKATVPRDVSKFVELYTPLIAANGFQVIPFLEKTDLYGIEMAIDLCSMLVKDYPQVGCLFFLAQIGDQNHYNNLTAKISRLGLNERFLLIIGENLVPTLKQATLFVRPTFVDGYGVSVTESLYLGVPALASDVCKREKGTIVFKCGDIDDFYQHTRQILDNYEMAKQTVQAIKPVSAYKPLLAIYRYVADNGF